MGSSGKAQLTVRLDTVEVARGDDGWLRGRPEPTLLVAAGVVGPHGAVLAGRAVARLPKPDKIPVTSAPTEICRLSAEHRGAPTWFFVLWMALEQDGGDDVRRLFAALEAPRRLALCAMLDGVLEPVDLAEAPGRFGSSPTPVDLMLDGGHLSFSSDDWVGGAYLAARTDAGRRDRVRFHFADVRGDNDWTACATVTVRAQRAAR